MPRDALGSYLESIGKIPLLTPEEEILHGKAVQKLMALLEIKAELQEKLRREPTALELAEKAKLNPFKFKQIINSGIQSRKRMIEGNLRLVVTVAKKYCYPQIDVLDLIQEGNIGLKRAVEKFDPTQGNKFSTYAYWWIRQAITRFLKNHSRTIRLPLHIHETQLKIRRTISEIEEEKGVHPTVCEISTKLNIPSEKVRENLQYFLKPRSLDLKVGEKKDINLIDLIVDDRDLSNFDRLLLEEEVDTLLQGLTLKEREIIELRFGFTDGQEKSLREVANIFHISRERIRQIEAKALEKLKENKEKIQHYFAVS